MESELEQRLLQQPLKEPPAAWRGQILAAALPAVRPLPSASILFIATRRWLAFFRLQRAAGVGLAATWVLILALNFSLREPASLRTETTAPSAELATEFLQQQRLLAELLGPLVVHEADRPRIFTPKPRGERTLVLAT